MYGNTFCNMPKPLRSRSRIYCEAEADATTWARRLRLRKRFRTRRVRLRSSAMLPFFLTCTFLGGGDHQGPCCASNNFSAAARRFAFMRLITRPFFGPDAESLFKVVVGTMARGPKHQQEAVCSRGAGAKGPGPWPGGQGPGARARDPGRGPGSGPPNISRKRYFALWGHPIDAPGLGARAPNNPGPTRSTRPGGAAAGRVVGCPVMMI